MKDRILKFVYCSVGLLIVFNVLFPEWYLTTYDYRYNRIGRRFIFQPPVGNSYFDTETMFNDVTAFLVIGLVIIVIVKKLPLDRWLKEKQS